MKRKNKKIIFLGTIILIIIIYFNFNKQNKSNLFQDDILFFKFFNSIFQNNTQEIKNENQLNNYPQYIFKVEYNNIDFKNINLADTINKETLVREKIAPRNKR